MCTGVLPAVDVTTFFLPPQLPIDHVIKNLLCKSLEMFQM